VNRVPQLRISCRLAAAVLLCVYSFGQGPPLQKKRAAEFPTVVFSSVFWAANPSYYSIIVDSSGTATYRSQPDSLIRTGVPFVVIFKMTTSTTESILKLLQELNFLDENIPHSTSSPENKPVRTLEVYYSGRRDQLTYSDSDNAAVRELTSIFEQISQTLELGHDLTVGRKPQQISATLQQIESRLARRSLAEPQALMAILRGIAENQSLGSELRARASRLLADLKTSPLHP